MDDSRKYAVGAIVLATSLFLSGVSSAFAADSGDLEFTADNTPVYEGGVVPPGPSCVSAATITLPRADHSTKLQLFVESGHGDRSDGSQFNSYERDINQEISHYFFDFRDPTDSGDGAGAPIYTSIRWNPDTCGVAGGSLKLSNVTATQNDEPLLYEGDASLGDIWNPNVTYFDASVQNLVSVDGNGFANYSGLVRKGDEIQHVNADTAETTSQILPYFQIAKFVTSLDNTLTYKVKYSFLVQADAN